MNTASGRPFSAQHFWLRPVSAAGFGLMRIGFGFVAFATLALEWPQVQRFFGPDGVLPREMVDTVLRDAWRFSLLDHASAATTNWLYALLLVSLAFVTVGLFTRVSMLLSAVLLFSFHEYGAITLDGGDTLLRLLAFLLVLSPCDRALSLSNLFRRFRIARESGKEQDPSERTMPIWPYRLLLWQMICLYAASVIEKLSGTTWETGSAVAIVLHHGHFTRLPLWAADNLTFLSPALSYFTLLSQGAWILLLPLGLLSACRIVIGPKGFDTAKRALILCGILVHGGILLLLDVGTFSLTVFVAYLGLLTDNDFRAIRSALNKRMTEPLTVLFDGRCGFCAKTVIVLRSFDWLHRLQFRNFHDIDVRRTYAPNIDLKTLNEAMHVRLPDGSHRKGFDGFRALTKHLPALWILRPLLFIPPVPAIGDRVYRWVAAHR